MHRFFLFVLLFILSCKGNTLRMVGTSMEDAISEGEIVKITGTDPIQRNDIVAFKYIDDKEERIWALRVIGLPGEQVIIKDGKVFIDRVEMADPSTVKFSYYVETADRLEASEFQTYQYIPISDSEYIFSLTNAQKMDLAKEEKVLAIADSISKVDSDPIRTYRRYNLYRWNADNHGPISVPTSIDSNENYYFLLGDNRHNAYDSRYIGLIAESQIIGKITK